MINIKSNVYSFKSEQSEAIWKNKGESMINKNKEKHQNSNKTCYEVLCDMEGVLALLQP